MAKQSSCVATVIAEQSPSYPVQPLVREGRVTFGLVMMFLFGLYSQIALLVPGASAFAPMNLLGGLAIAAVIAQKLVLRRGVVMVWPESYLLLAFVGIAFLSCLTALWPRYALESTMDLLKYVAVYFLILQTVTTSARLRTVFWGLCLGALFPAFGTLANYWRGNLTEGRAAWIGIFANPNEVAYSLVILVPIAAYLCVTASAGARAFLCFAMGVYAAAIFVTYSRGGLLALLVVVALLGVWWRSAPVMIATVVVLAATAGFMAYGWTRSEGFVSLGSDLNLQQRLTTFQGALAMFMENPLSGVGLGCSLIAWPLYAPAGLYTRSWLVIHNTFLQALCETGVLGFLAFTACLGSVSWKTRRVARSASSAIPRADRLGSSLAVALAGFVVCGMSGGYILTWFPYILLAVASATFLIIRTHDQEIRQNEYV